MTMKNNIDAPPRLLSILVFFAGITTAILGIYGFEILARRLDKNFILERTSKEPAQIEISVKESQKPEKVDKSDEVTMNDNFSEFDQASIKLPGEKIVAASTDQPSRLSEQANSQDFTEQDLEVAKHAWKYFEKNWQKQTGLVNSVDGFSSVTLWDQSAAIAALVSAFELEIINEEEFSSKMQQSLITLANLELYNEELPNKVYNSQTLIPVNYGQLEKVEKIGWSAIDLGRLALWLKIVSNKYPEFSELVQQVWQSWNVDRLVQNQQMYGTSSTKGKESYYQEGRLGYENYAAYGLKLWGLDVEKALDYHHKSAFVSLYDVSIPFDIRDHYNSKANNYVLSEPYILDGIETGFQSLPKNYAQQILLAQESRYNVTGQLTALTEDNLDRSPYFLYNTLYVNGKPWQTITDSRKKYNNLRFLSTKAAVGFFTLTQTEYTNKLFDFVVNNMQGDAGWYSGYYESLQETNKSLTANNNGIILECMLFKKVKQPLLVWSQL